MKTTELKIRYFGDSVLRKRAAKVELVTEEHRELLSCMARLMHDSKGVGLAAPQVGISECLIVVDAGNGLYKLVNPKITRRRGVQTNEEGCLSVPGVFVNVRRAKVIVVESLDHNGESLVFEAQGLLACVIQHEIDHLNAKLITDYASVVARLKLRKRIASLRKAGHEKRLPQST